MSDDTQGAPLPGGAERRLEELLALLQASPPAPPELLGERIVGAVRWERGVRHTGLALGGFGASLLEGLAVLLGLRKTQR
jgi:hypothetical protein